MNTLFGQEKLPRLFTEEQVRLILMDALIEANKI